MLKLIKKPDVKFLKNPDTKLPYKYKFLTIFAAIPCGIPSQKDDTGFALVEQEFGMIKIAYYCKPDYEAVSGDNVSFCLPNNTWSGRRLVCQGVLKSLNKF